MKEELARRMARKCRRIVEGILYEWEAPEAEHEFYEAILEELQTIPDIPRHEWSLRRCARMNKMMRQGWQDLYEALRQLELSGELQPHEGHRPVAGGDMGE